MPLLYGTAAALLAVVGFSARSVWLKIILERSDLDAFAVLFFRLLFALPLCVLMAWPAVKRLKTASLSVRSVVAFFVFGPTAFYLSLYLDQTGLAYIPATAERLILFVYPTLTLLFTAKAEGKRVSGHDWAGSAAAYAGVAVVFRGDLPSSAVAGGMGGYLFGSACVAASAVVYALFVTLSRSYIARLGAAAYSGLVMACAMIPALVHALLFASVPAWERALPVSGWLLASAILGTALPVWLFAEAVKRIGAPSASALSVSGPPLTLAFGALVLGEPLTLTRAAGALLAMAGVAYLTVPALRERVSRRLASGAA